MLNLENLKRYLLEGLAIALVTSVLPKKRLVWYEVASIVLVSALTLLILDMSAPEVLTGYRSGAGFGIGANHVGFGEGFHCGSCGKDGKHGDEENFDCGGAKYSEDDDIEYFENRQRDFKVVEGFSPEKDFETLEQFNKEELNKKEDDDDDDLDNIEGFFREEFADQGYKEGFVGANITEAFQSDPFAFQAPGIEQNSGLRPNTTDPDGQTASQRGLVYGNLIGGEHLSKMQDICYHGDLINIRNELDGYVKARFLEAGASARNTDVVVGQENKPRLDKLRVVLNNRKKNFDKLILIRLGTAGDLVSFVHNHKEKDVYLAAVNGKIVSNYNPKDKDDTSHLFQIFEPDAGESTTVLNFNTPYKIQYVGGNNPAGDGFLIHDTSSGVLSTAGNINNATTFLLSKCEIGCYGPLWRFNASSRDARVAETDYELETQTVTPA